MYHFLVPRAEEARVCFDQLQSYAITTSDVIPGGCLLMAQDLLTGAEIWGAGIAADQSRRALQEIATTAGTIAPPLDAIPPEADGTPPPLLNPPPPTRERPRWRG